VGVELLFVLFLINEEFSSFMYDWDFDLDWFYDYLLLIGRAIGTMYLCFWKGLFEFEFELPVTYAVVDSCTILSYRIGC
jgi:hypothetical protein